MNNRQKWPYPLRGFLWGFGILVVAFVVLGLARHFYLKGYPGVGKLLAVAVVIGLSGMLVGVIIPDIQKTAELRWRPYVWRGFLWGFGIPAVPTVVIGVPGFFIALANVHPGDPWSGIGPPIVLALGGIGLGIAVVTGLIGMLIGYIVYRKKRRRQLHPPKCGKCGYSLVGLTGDKCPECGHTVSTTAPPPPSPSGQVVKKRGLLRWLYDLVG